MEKARPVKICSYKNQITEAAHPLTVLESRLFWVFASQFQRGKSGGGYVIPWACFKIIDGRFRREKYIKEALNGLLSKKMYMLDEESETAFVYVSQFEINHGNYVRVFFPPGVENLLNYFNEKQYSSGHLGCLLTFQRETTSRLYTFLSRRKYEGSPSITIEIDKLRKLLGVEELTSYSSFSELARRVLKKAQADFKKQADLTFSFSPIKKGAKVVKVKFNVNARPTYQKSLLNEIHQIMFNTEMDVTDEPQVEKSTVDQKEGQPAPHGIYTMTDDEKNLLKGFYNGGEWLVVDNNNGKKEKFFKTEITKALKDGVLNVKDF